jgi:hypothetical protein
MENIRKIGLAEHAQRKKVCRARNTRAFLPRNMKRAMSQSTMCLKCFEPVLKGWKQAHHIKQCKGRPDTHNFTQAKATLQNNVDDLPSQDETDVDVPGQDKREEQVHDMAQGGNITTHVVGGHPTTGQLRVSFHPKTKEILEFLGTAEMGEGCSREHAQGWLDYTKKKGGASTRLLPKDIRTCWEHVAKVTFIHAYIHLNFICLASFGLPAHSHNLPFTSFDYPIIHLLCRTLPSDSFLSGPCPMYLKNNSLIKSLIKSLIASLMK